MDRGQLAAMTADTDEWEDTERSIEAQGTLEEVPQMYEDTGVVIVNRPAEPGQSDRLVVTFREPSSGVTFREPKLRAATAGWPPEPREPAPIRERALRHAGVYTVVARPETKN